MATPTLIGMPKPPSNPDTPTEAPGTPNSTTTCLSALSTTAIKDGHRGAALPQHPHLGTSTLHNTPCSNALEAERADRISRLAGLERVSASRSSNPPTPYTTAAAPPIGQIPGYFDSSGNPVYTTRMSTVGTASATASNAGPTTTWASGSVKMDEDSMSVDTNSRDTNEDRLSVSASAMDEDGEGDGMSDEASLVAFGEGAGSTVSGPTYSTSRTNLSVGSGVANASPIVQVGRSAFSSAVHRDGAGTGTGAPSNVSTNLTVEQQRGEARMLDGVAMDTTGGLVDTTIRSPVNVGSGIGVETAERIMGDGLGHVNERKSPLGPSLGSKDLGKFYFEDKKR